MHLRFILAFSLLLTTLFSCSESFFDKMPVGIKSENIFCTEKGIDALLIGAYALVGGIAYDYYDSWGASVTNWSFGSAASDDAYIGG